MVDRDVLSTRLNALEGYLADLRPFAKRSREAFTRESSLHHLARRQDADGDRSCTGGIA